MSPLQDPSAYKRYGHRGHGDLLSERCIHLSVQRHSRRGQLPPSELQPWFRAPLERHQTARPGQHCAEESRRWDSLTDLPAEINHAGPEPSPLHLQSVSWRGENGGFVGTGGHDECVCEH